MLKRLSTWLNEQARRLKQEIYALYLAYRDPRTPWYARLLALMIVAYAISPLDLIPDFIPVLGHLDDLILLPAGIFLVLKLIPPEVMADARQHSAERIARNHPAARIAAVIIVLIWLLTAALIIAALTSSNIKTEP